MSRGADAVPHDGRVLNLIDDAGQVITEHACPHRLAPGLEEGDNSRDDGVEGAKDGDDDAVAVTGGQAGQSSAEDYLGQHQGVDHGGGEHVGAALAPSALDGSRIQRLRVRLVIVLVRVVDGTHADEAAELRVMVAAGVARERARASGELKQRRTVVHSRHNGGVRACGGTATIHGDVHNARALKKRA